jgi:type IV secretory pathway VirB2 component (pilin)
MKNLKFKSAAIVLFTSAVANAQTLDLETPVQNIKTQMENIFPWVIAILFLIVVMVNMGHFIKESGDWKKGVGNILLFVIIVGAVVGLYSGISSISL